MTSEESTPEQKQSSGRVVIWVAIIGLVGTLGTAVISNWDKLFPQKSSAVPLASNSSQTNSIVEVEKLAGKWMAAWLNGDSDTFVSLSSEPFFFDHNLVLTKSELRSDYLKLRKEKGHIWTNLKVSSIKVQTAGELKDQGHDLSKDRIFRSLNLTLDDYAVSVTVDLDGDREGMLLVVRQMADSFEIVGLWD